jgi:hypothetical protein
LLFLWLGTPRYKLVLAEWALDIIPEIGREYQHWTLASRADDPPTISRCGAARLRNKRSLALLADHRKAQIGLRDLLKHLALRTGDLEHRLQALIVIQVRVRLAIA